MIQKAKGAKTAHKLLELAKAEGIDITADEAATYFAQLNPNRGKLCGDGLPLYSSAGIFLHKLFLRVSCLRVQGNSL